MTLISNKPILFSILLISLLSGNGCNKSSPTAPPLPCTPNPSVIASQNEWMRSRRIQCREHVCKAEGKGYYRVTMDGICIWEADKKDPNDNPCK